MPQPAPPIRKLSVFKQQTDIGILKGRSHLKPIDDLLRECDQIDLRRSQERIALLEELLDACADWVDGKAKKTDAKRTKRESGNTAQRRLAVEALFLEVSARRNFEVAARSTEQALTYQARKDRFVIGQRPLKSLGRGYHLEREQFVQERARLKNPRNFQYGKDVTISPISGGVTHDYLEYAPDENKPAFKEATLQTFEAALAFWHQMRITNAPRVAFMRKNERLDFLVMIRDGLLYHGQTPLHFPERAAFAAIMYVMDCYENLFAMRSEIRNFRASTAR